MASVRAKFIVNAIRRTASNHYPFKTADGKTDYDRPVETEMQTIEMSPVYSRDPNHENNKFWEATPSGKLELGTINLEAAKNFKLNKEYYIDFTPAN